MENGCIFYVCVFYKNILQVDSRNQNRYENFHKKILMNAIADLKIEFKNIPQEIVKLDPMELARDAGRNEVFSSQRNFNVWLVRDKIHLYACLTTKNFKKRLANDFIFSISKVHIVELEKLRKGKPRTAGAFVFQELNDEQKKRMRKLFKERLNYFNEIKNDLITAGRNQLKKVEDKLCQNIDEAVKRGNKLDKMLLKIEEIENQSEDIRWVGKETKKASYGARWKLLFFFVLVVLVLSMMAAFIVVLKILFL